MFQKSIFVVLILGLSFFLYLLKTGEIDSSTFNIKQLQGPVRFTIGKNATKDDFDNTLSEIKLLARGTEYPIYTFGGTDFHHIPKSEFYKKEYNIPLDAKDAVTGVWLGDRYIFYVLEIGAGNDIEYHVYRASFTTDYIGEIEYKQIKKVRNFTIVEGDDQLY